MTSRRLYSVFYIRTRNAAGSIVAIVEPTSSAVALGGSDETTTIDLLDARCRVLDTHIRTGWGDFKGTIEGTSLTIEPGMPPPPDIGSYGYSARCHA